MTVRRPGPPEAITSRATLWWTAAGVMIAVLGIVITVAITGPGGEASAKGGDQGAQITGDNNTVTNFQQFQQDIAAQPDDAAVTAAAAKYANTPPDGSGPWPFVVIDVNDLGLMVRTSGERGGQQVGSAGNRATVWATCSATTTFIPPAHTDVGPTWVRIRWPGNTPTKNFFNSSPSDQYTGWVYRGYLVPAGHNGDIPKCH